MSISGANHRTKKLPARMRMTTAGRPPRSVAWWRFSVKLTMRARLRATSRNEISSPRMS